MPAPLRGVLHAAGAAFWGALFLIPYQAATAAAEHRLAAVLAMLIGAALCNSLVMGVQGRGHWRIDRTALRAALVLAGCTVLGNIAVAASLQQVAPAITSVVVQTQIILVAVGELVFLRARLTPSLMVGALIAVGGFVVMQAPWAAAVAGSRLGAIWALVAAGCFACMLLVTRHLIERIDVVSVNALRLWLAVVLLACWPGSLAGLVELDLRIWLLALAAGACGPTLGRLQLMWSVRHIPATTAKLVTLISPVVALILGLLLLASWPTPRELVGGGILLAGVALPLAGYLWRRRGGDGVASTRA